MGGAWGLKGCVKAVAVGVIPVRGFVGLFFFPVFFVVSRRKGVIV